MARILIVDDEPADLRLLAHALEKVEHEVVTAATAKQALRLLRSGRFDVAILDIILPDGSGLDLLQRVADIKDHLPVVFVTSSTDSGTAIQAMKSGALDYLIKPVEISELRRVIARAVEIRRLTEKPIELNVEYPSPDRDAIIGRCSAMQEVYKAIGIVAAQDVTILIRGESGTGKELVARALYQYGERVRGPFLAVNCAAIPETLLESELFGHERGAFTGADRKRIGKFEQCSGGTLFLDEIGDMSPVLQSKMLRVLQEKQFERVGGNETIASDVRVIAATNRNLETMVADGLFRSDLYYRLNGFTIHLPPLRERGGDLEMLVEHFRRTANDDLKKNVRQISAGAMEQLRQYSWPGNVRELQNAIRQAVLKTIGPILLPDFLPAFVRTRTIQEPEQAAKTTNNLLQEMIDKRFESGSPHVYEDIIDHVELRLVEGALQRAGGDKPKAAKLLGIAPETLRSKAARALFDLDRSEGLHENNVVVRPGLTIDEIEKEAIRQALEQTKGCRKEAAKLLGISIRTMHRRLRELDLR